MIGVVIATCRLGGLELPLRSLRRNEPDGWQLYAVLDGPAKDEAPAYGKDPDVTVVAYEGPPYYSEEMALNAGGDAAVKDGCTQLVFMADHTWLDGDDLYAMSHYMIDDGDRHLVSGACCRHDGGPESPCGRRDPTDAVCGGPIVGPRPAGLNLVFFVFTGMTAEAWVTVNGFDERFAGGNGYIDTNIARRVEAAFGSNSVHINTDLVGHRRDYRTQKLAAPKKKLYPPERNMALDIEIFRREVMFGEVRAVRFYDGPNTPAPDFDGKVQS